MQVQKTLPVCQNARLNWFQGEQLTKSSRLLLLPPSGMIWCKHKCMARPRELSSAECRTLYPLPVQLTCMQATLWHPY